MCKRRQSWAVYDESENSVARPCLEPLARNAGEACVSPSNSRTEETCRRSAGARGCLRTSGTIHRDKVPRRGEEVRLAFLGQRKASQLATHLLFRAARSVPWLNPIFAQESDTVIFGLLGKKAPARSSIAFTRRIIVIIARSKTAYLDFAPLRPQRGINELWMRC